MQAEGQGFEPPILHKILKIRSSGFFLLPSNGGDSGSDLPKMDVSEYADCTQNTANFEADNNTTWSVKFENNDSSFGSASSRAADATPPFTIVIDVTATYSANDFTFTYAKFTQTMKTSDCYKEGFDQYKNGSPEYKALINATVIQMVGQQLQQLGFGTLIQSESSMDENYIRLVYTLSDTYRQQFETAFKQSLNNSNKNLKTNAGKNKYILKVSNKSYYMKKL